MGRERGRIFLPLSWAGWPVLRKCLRRTRQQVLPIAMEAEKSVVSSDERDTVRMVKRRVMSCRVDVFELVASTSTSNRLVERFAMPPAAPQVPRQTRGYTRF